MTTERSDPAHTGVAGTLQADAPPSKTSTGGGARAAEAGEALREGTRHLTGAPTRLRRSETVRRASANAATRTRRLAGWARRNPKAAAGAVASAAALGPAAWRRITRRGRRR